MIQMMLILSVTFKTKQTVNVEKYFVVLHYTNTQMSLRSPASYIQSALYTFCLLKPSADDFASCLGPHQTRQNVGPNLELNCLTLPWYT